MPLPGIPFVQEGARPVSFQGQKRHILKLGLDSLSFGGWVLLFVLVGLLFQVAQHRVP